MKSLLIFIAVIICIGLASVVGLRLSTADRNIRKLAEMEVALKGARDEITQLKATLEEERRMRLKSGPRANATLAADSSAVAQPKDPAAAFLDPNSPNTGAAGKNMGKMLRQMMENPDMRQAMQQQQLAQLDLMYGRLYQSFNLSPEELDNFKMLLAQRLQTQTDLGLKMMDSELNAEQRQALTKEIESARAASDQAIQTFLNDENDYQVFKHWEDTQPERMQLEMGGRMQFESAGVPLTPDQEMKLIDAMASIRNQPGDFPDLTKPQNMDPSKMNSETIARYLQYFDRNAEEVSKLATTFLSPEQMQALAKMQSQTRAMTETGLRMSSAMFNGGQDASK